jgi:hypothetical protein
MKSEKTYAEESQTIPDIIHSNVDLKIGKPLKKPFIVFREETDLPWPAHYHAPYYVYVNPEGKGVVGYTK